MDKATGAHYGVPTCEGCKGFFKRSILRKEKYRCYFGDGCVITSDNRNRCKACRFQKCLKEGMSVQGVRMGRIPKLVKEKALAECQHSSDESTQSLTSTSPARVPSSNSNSNPLLSTDFDLPLIDEQFYNDDFPSISLENLSVALPSCTSYVLPENFTIDETKLGKKRVSEPFASSFLEKMKILAPKIAHQTDSIELDEDETSFIDYLRKKTFDLCQTYNQRTKQLIERMESMIDLGIRQFPGDHSSLQDIWAGLTDAIPFHVKNLIAFAREIPAINEFDPEDFQTIINNRLFDFWMIKHAPLMRQNESFTMLPNGLQYTRRWMTEIIGEEMVTNIFQFATQLNSLELKDEEYALLFPIIICSQDESLVDSETVRCVQDSYLYALYLQMVHSRTSPQARKLFRQLLQIIDLLHLLNELQAKKIDPLIPKVMEYES